MFILSSKNISSIYRKLTKQTDTPPSESDLSPISFKIAVISNYIALISIYRVIAILVVLIHKNSLPVW